MGRDGGKLTVALRSVRFVNEGSKEVGFFCFLFFVFLFLI